MLQKTLSALALMVALILFTALVQLPLARAQQAQPVDSQDQLSLRNLIQQLIDARLNYGQNLYRLVEFYEKNGNIQRRTWAKYELEGFRKINQRDYLPGMQPKLIKMDLAEFSESDIVEALAEYRQTYRHNLESLVDLFKQAKDTPRWMRAKDELKDLISVNKYCYLRDADTPSSDLQPLDQIAPADELYSRALKLKKDSRPFFANRYKTQLAIEAFRKLIRDYPTSDKIDEAAYHIAEICRENLKDYQRAVRWYECVLAWNPDTQLPVNYRIARIYDKNLVNRLAALNYYRRALQQAPRGSSQHKDIRKRIDKLRGK